MIIKVTDNKSIHATLLYNQRKVEMNDASILFANKLFVSGPEDVVESLEKQFQIFCPHGTKIKEPVLHISINPPPNMVCDDYQLEAYARFFLERMELNDQPFIVYKHNDIDRPHLHIVTTHVDKTGKALIHNGDTQQAFLEWREKNFSPVISFGKHKGTLISDLPQDYIEWMREQKEKKDNAKKVLAVLDNNVPNNWREATKFGFKPIRIQACSRLRTMRIRQEMLETFPELKQALDELSVSKKTRKAYVFQSDDNIKVDYRKGNLRSRLRQALMLVHAKYNFTSIGEYNAILQLYNIQAKPVMTDKRGNPAEGMVYVITDSEGKELSTPLKGSDLDRKLFTGKAVNQLFKDNKRKWSLKYRTGKKGPLLSGKREYCEGLNRKQQRLKSRVLNAMRFAKSIEDLTNLLRKNSISLCLRYTDEGRLYGVSFVDKTQEISMNGSRLDELFSAQNMEGWAQETERRRLFINEAMCDALFLRSLRRIRKLVYGELKDPESHAARVKERLAEQGITLIKLNEKQLYYYDTRSGIIVSPDDVNRKFSIDDFDDWKARINELNYIHEERRSTLASGIVDELLADDFDRSAIDASKDTALHNKFKRQMRQKRH